MRRVKQARRPILSLVVACVGVLVVVCAGQLRPVSVAAQSTSISSLPLLQIGDLAYTGVFRLPSWQSDANSVDYGGAGLVYNANNASLLMVGHRSFQKVVEVSVPAAKANVTMSQLSRASIVQFYTDVLAGHRLDVDGGKSDGAYIGGLLPSNGALIASVYDYYDANAGQTLSHFKTGLNFSSLGTVLGPYVVGNGQAGFVSGYMTPIPSEWQAALGGTAFTGNCCLSIISRTSYGPSVSVFNPGDVGVLSPVPATRVLGYPSAHTTIGGYSPPGVLFNGAVTMGGVVFPSGTRSVLFFGRINIGPYCYGQGTDDPSLNGQVVPNTNGVIYCYDPAAPQDKGTHGYPYSYFVWAYDANDLVAVKNGTKAYWEPVPYATWSFALPLFQADTGPSLKRLIEGVAYDDATHRIFLTAGYQDGMAPLVHVYTVQAGSPPAAPQSLSVTVNGTGAVVSSPAGLNCSSGPCSANFAAGSIVQLIATPASGWTLSGWTGACAGSATCYVPMTGAKSATATFVPGGTSTPPTSVPYKERGDFTGDGKADLVWQEPTTGAALLWEMNGAAYVRSTMLNSVATSWQVVGAADFTGDGKPDLVWQDPVTGTAVVWQMDGTTLTGRTLLGQGGTAWRVAGTEDLTGDGKPDLIWQNSSTGGVILWEMNGTSFVNSIVLNAGGTLWQVVGAGDFTGDGKPDLVWQHPSSGALLLWQMNGSNYAGGMFLSTGGTYWKATGVDDYTGDGKPDLIWQHPTSGEVLLWKMNGTAYVGSTILNTGGTYWKVKGPK